MKVLLVTCVLLLAPSCEIVSQLSPESQEQMTAILDRTTELIDEGVAPEEAAKAAVEELGASPDVLAELAGALGIPAGVTVIGMWLLDRMRNKRRRKRGEATTETEAKMARAAGTPPDPMG